MHISKQGRQLTLHRFIHVLLHIVKTLKKMLKDVGPKSIEARAACKQRQVMIACNNNNMRNPISLQL